MVQIFQSRVPFANAALNWGGVFIALLFVYIFSSENVSHAADVESLRLATQESERPAGKPLTFTVTAINAEGTTDTGYKGTVRFASSDTNAELMKEYTFGNEDKGVHAFRATLVSAGAQSISAADAANDKICDMLKVQIKHGDTSQFKFLNLPRQVVVNDPFICIVVPSDSTGSTIQAYKGTLVFSSSDPKAVLPQSYTFDGKEGAHAFSFTLKSPGTHSLSVKDSQNDSIVGKQENIEVKPASDGK